MKKPSRGQIVWIYPGDEELLNQLGLVIDVENSDVLVMMCSPDIRLAGHLDAILSSVDTGAPFAIGVFTHVLEWLPLLSIGLEPIGSISEENCFELEQARSGISLRTLVPGRMLGDPISDLRWPLIEQAVMDFINVARSAAKNLGTSVDDAEFDKELFKRLEEWELESISFQRRIELQTEIELLVVRLNERPDLISENDLFEMTKYITGTALVAA